MRKIRFFSALFGLLGICAASMGIYLALNNMEASPVLVEQPEAAEQQVVSMLDGLCAGDYAAVSAAIQGNPSLGLDRQPEDEVSALMWNALSDSYSYELVGDFYATDSGVARNVVITAMDITSVTATIGERSEVLLEALVREAESPDEIYDENYEYREEIVMDCLYQAAQAALDEDATTISWELTLNLVYQNGQWWIVPDAALLEAISGGIMK